MKYLGIQHFVIIPYRPQANGIVERRNGEVLKHLRAIVMERRVKEKWSRFLPIAQNILNNAIDFSLGETPSRILFGDSIKSTVEWIVNKDKDRSADDVSNYIIELNQISGAIIQASRNYMEKKDKDRREKLMKIGEVKCFEIGDYVLVTYPVRPPDKLSPIYRGPLIVMEKVSDDIYRCKDIISGKILTFHVERLREFKVSPSIMPSELIEWAAVDKDEFLVESIIEHRGSGRSGDPLSFRIRWEGYGPEDDSWLPYREVKDLSALDEYESRFPDVLRYVKRRGRK